MQVGWDSGLRRCIYLQKQNELPKGYRINTVVDIASLTGYALNNLYTYISLKCTSTNKISLEFSNS